MIDKELMKGKGREGGNTAACVCNGNVSAQLWIKGLYHISVPAILCLSIGIRNGYS